MPLSRIRRDGGSDPHFWGSGFSTSRPILDRILATPIPSTQQWNLFDFTPKDVGPTGIRS